ncbi:MAG: hypothetical protein JNK72_04850 [Myxococcales bacterium]|nr:hypothetical protein [Myxococcales bacterium]
MSPSNDPLDAAWATLEAHWSEPERHKTFVALAHALDRLPEAARRYRAVSEDPALAVGARQGLDRVLAAAMASLTPAALAPRPSRALLIVPMALAGLVVSTSVMAATLLRLPRLASPLTLCLEVALVFLLPWQRMLKKP